MSSLAASSPFFILSLLSWIKHCIMQPYWYQPISRYSYMLLNVPMIKWCDLHNHIFELGKWHCHAVISVLNDLIPCIWIPCILLPFLRTSLIQENTDNWKTFYLHFFREATFISSELHQNEKSFPGIALWTTDRSVETTANPAPADCSITCKKGSVSHFAVTSPFQNSAKLLSFRYLFLKPPGNAELWQKLQKVLVLCKLNPPDVPIPQHYFRLFGTEDMDR